MGSPLPSLACLDCGKLSQGSRCPACATARRRSKERQRAAHRPSPYQRGYNAEYRRNRAIVLADGPCCFVEGCTAAATTVDHILPLSLGGTNELDNLRPACRRHNASRANRLDWEA
ncbi:hypothetical protein ACG83_25985 [Frankia sp. R43]|uniref:HNH endonuclease n=1 Tax=Frankia sp. R43 TaxID=269536 RepID=UPI0006DB1ABB|nr:hypothetical protein ACG83_25985 [Frankia sp. R43]